MEVKNLYDEWRSCVDEKTEMYKELDAILEINVDDNDFDANFKFNMHNNEFDNMNVDAIGVLPTYKLRKVERGKGEDTFFISPLHYELHDNAHVINVITSGSDEDVMGLNNFSISTPGVKIKCDHALECKMHVDATAYLIMKHGLSLPSVYRRIAMVSDRICLGCKTPSLKMSPMAGKWRCNHCHSNGRCIGFEEGFIQWLNNGSPTRHTCV